jgi:carbonic anhydrase
MSARTRIVLSALACAWLAGSALAAPAQWQAVASSAGNIVEIDQSRIARLASGKTSAWTRLTLDHPVLDFENQTRYTTVQALNHYDCVNRSYATQKRVYILDDRTIKTERVASPRPLPAQADSLDARLLDAACQPRNSGEMRQTAARAARQAAAANEARPRPMHAEMVSAAEVVQPRGMKVADAPASAPAVEKPRMFDMPVIDKSKVEDPYKGATPAPAASVPAATARPAAAPAARPAVKAPTPAPAPVAEVGRKERELQLATSGPRKAKPKKPAVPKEPDYSHVHWGYAGLGAPENWAKIKPDYATCAVGTRQSPIDIRNGIKVDLEQLRFDYRNTQFRIVDNGHTVQVNVGEGSSISLLGKTYQLVQFHFHRPSEERINGKPFDMVIHLVHKDYDNNLAVVAVLIEKGSEHPVIQTLWNNMPLEVGQEVMPPNLAIDLSKFLPARRDYYTYMGSLTTPPCTENVLWLVFKTPIQVSPEQIGIFSRLYPNNARPVQPANDRLIKESR